MFTGLVQELGTVAAAGGGRLEVEAPGLELRPGDSVAVNGVCLTAAEVSDGRFAADVVDETLRRSSLGRLEPGGRVNLELPLRPTDRLGGHIVQGHVDGLGAVGEVADEGAGRRLTIEADPELLRYVVEKGSIAVDGVSLTVAALDGDGFEVALIPETLERTTLGQLWPGDKVNLEVDVAPDLNVSMDATKVQQALLNLAKNAIGASPPRQSVTLHGLLSKERKIWFEVVNVGPAISKDVLQQIFEPFFTTKQGGAGLGLAIARNIARAHGGDLFLRVNEPGRVCFTLELPATLATDENKGEKTWAAS